MSDEVVVPVEEVATTEVAPDTTVTATDVESPVVGEEKPEAPKEAKTFTQDELDRIVAKEKAKASRKTERELQRDIDRKVEEALARSKPAAEPVVEPTKPTPEQFKTTEEYVEAVADWKAEQKINAREKTVEQQRQEERRRQYLQTVETSFAEREEAAREKYEDYDEVTRSNHVPITDAMADAIKLMDKGPDVAYYLGSPAGIAEAKQIAKLHPLKQAQALARIEDKLASAPAPEKTSSAPAPITPIGRPSGSVVMDTTDPRSLKKMGMDAWMKADRERQLREAKLARG